MAAGVNWVYLTPLLIYLIGVLLVGLWGKLHESYESYVIADRKVGLVGAAGTFFATYVSAGTVIGITGFITLNGAAILPAFYWGIALGWVLLVVLGGKIHSLHLTTVPELFHERFRSQGLRAIIGLVIVASFLVAIMTQLVAGGVIVRTLTGLSNAWGIVLIGVVLTVYTMLGGLKAVIRTDLVQGALLLFGVILASIVVFGRLGIGVFDLPPAKATLYAGPMKTNFAILTALITVMGGNFAQPYYLHRFNATKDKATARQMIGIGGLFVALLYALILVIGLGLPKLVPADQLGDKAFPYFALNVAGGVLGPLIVIAVVAAIQSTLDSALHLTGVYFAADVVSYFRRGMDNAALLRLARWATGVFGALAIAGAIYSAMGGVLVIDFVLILLGMLASALFVPLLAALLWKRASTAGAIVGTVAGFAGYGVAFVLKLAINPTLVGFGLSLVLLVGVSLLTRPVAPEHLERFFPTAAPGEGVRVRAI